MRLPFDLKTIVFGSMAMLIFCGCPKKRQKGVVEVIEYNNLGAYHCYAVQDDAPGLSPNTPVRDDRYLKVFSGRSRAFAYFWPDMSAAKLGYKKKVNADEDYFIFENYAPAEDGYWVTRTDYQPIWERRVSCYSDLSSSSTPTISLNGQQFPVYSTEHIANLNANAYLNIEAPVTWTFSSSTGTVNQAAFNREFNLVKVVASTITPGQYELRVNGSSAFNVIPPPVIAGTWSTSVCTSNKQQQWVFNCNGTGQFVNPDCSNNCTPMTLPFTYTVSGSVVNLTYSTPPALTCNTGTVSVTKPNNESYSFLLTPPSDLRLSQGTKVYNLKKQGACQ